MKHKNFFGIAVVEKEWVKKAGVEEFLKDLPKPLEGWSEVCRGILISGFNTSEYHMFVQLEIRSNGVKLLVPSQRVVAIVEGVQPEDFESIGFKWKPRRDVGKD